MVTGLYRRWLPLRTSSWYSSEVLFYKMNGHKKRAKEVLVFAAGTQKRSFEYVCNPGNILLPLIFDSYLDLGHLPQMKTCEPTSDWLQPNFLGSSKKLQIHGSQLWVMWFMKLLVGPECVILSHSLINSTFSCHVNIGWEVFNNLKSWERRAS